MFPTGIRGLYGRIGRSCNILDLEDSHLNTLEGLDIECGRRTSEVTGKTARVAVKSV
jgi:hypothetical protein